MKKLLSVLFLLLTFSNPAYAYQYNEPHTMQSQLESARSKTVRVLPYKETRFEGTIVHQYGTGAILDGGFIITNAHVLYTDYNRISVYTYDGKEYSAEVVKTDDKNDIALLKIDTDIPGFTISKVEPYAGMRVMSVGHPAGLPSWSFSEGTMLNLAVSYICPGKDYLDIHFPCKGYEFTGYMSDNQILGGNSGGPLINEYGELIGIIRAKMNPDDYALSIPIDVVNSFLQENEE